VEAPGLEGFGLDDTQGRKAPLDLFLHRKVLLQRSPDSVGELARTCYRVAQSLFPDHAHRFSPKKFTQPQLWGMLLFRRCAGLSYRDLVGRIRQSAQLRAVFQLRRPPNFSTLSHAERRLNAMKPEGVFEVAWIASLSDWVQKNRNLLDDRHHGRGG